LVDPSPRIVYRYRCIALMIITDEYLAVPVSVMNSLHFYPTSIWSCHPAGLGAL